MFKRRSIESKYKIALQGINFKETPLSNNIYVSSLIGNIVVRAGC